jgi:CheY-like chemotaxis protein
MVAGAVLLAGGLVGFLFGIPRSPSLGGIPPAGALEGHSGEAITQYSYRPNTNLEQISDWLTTILVGIGLTQLGSIADNLRQLSTYLAPVLGGLPGSSVFALTILLYFVICGFLLGYLWARLFLPGAFQQADLSLIRRLAERQALSTAATLIQQRDTSEARSINTRGGTRSSHEEQAVEPPSILWVDDNPANNLAERQSLEAILKVRFTTSTSTEEALDRLDRDEYRAVISDMSRPPDRRAGYTLLEAMRRSGDNTPVIFYTSPRSTGYSEEARKKGALGQTSSPQELLKLAAEALRD